MDAFWSALADFLAKMEHQKASGRANLTKLDVKKTGLKKHRKMKGYGWSRWRCWWGQAEGGESKDSSSGVFCIDFETATSLSDGPDPVPAANNRHRAYSGPWIYRMSVLPVWLYVL